MPGLHFTSPYGHVKPPLLHALSLKRKKSHVAAAAAAAVLKAFTNPRGKNVLVRQGVKYRNMFHAGSGLVRERRPGEEVTPEKGWVTDEESEQSETEGSEDAAPAMEEAPVAEEVIEAAESIMEESESLILEVHDDDESLDLIHEEEATKNDLLKLELSLAEKEFPEVSVPETIVVKVEEKVMEVQVIPIEPELDTPVTQEEAPIGEANQPAPEQIVVEVAMQIPPNQEPVDVITHFEEKVPDVVVLVQESKPELLLEPPGPEPLTLSAVMNVHQPFSQLEPLPLSAMMDVMEPPSQSAPFTLSAVMNIVERPSEPKSMTPPATVVVLESPEPVPVPVTEPTTTEVPEPAESDDVLAITVPFTPDIQQSDMPVEVETVQEAQEEIAEIQEEGLQEIQAAHTNVEEPAAISLIETLEPTPEVHEVEDIPSNEMVESEPTPIAPVSQSMPEPMVTIPEPAITMSEPTPEPVVTMSEPIPEPVVTMSESMPVPVITISEPTPEPLVTISEPTSAVPEPTVSVPEPIISTPEPAIEVEPEVQHEESEEKVVDKAVPISVQVVSPQPSQETPVLAISEKHSEQLFDDEVCDYTETELNEDEESEVEFNDKHKELEGQLESTPSHIFKLTLSLPISTNPSGSSTVALCVRPEQTLSDLQQLIQQELSHSSSKPSHISFTTIAIDSSDHSVLRRPSCCEYSKQYSKPTGIPTRWSLSTEIGTFIGDAAKSQCFTIEISSAHDTLPSATIRVSLPTFDDRTSHMRSQLRILGPNLSSLSALKSECDLLAQRSAQRQNLLKLSISGFTCLLLPLILMTFTYFSQPGLLPSFRNPLPWDTNPSHPVTTYLAAGIVDILLLAGFAYLWSAYRSNGKSLPDLATIKQVYSERGFDIKKWEELQAENKRLRSEIRQVAAEYGVTWDDDEVEETKETGTAATAA